MAGKKGLPGILIVLLALFSSCENECFHKPLSMLNADFFTIDEGEEGEVTVDDVSVFAIGREDTLLYDSASVRRISMPLDPNSDITAFVLLFGDIADTLTFHHTAAPYFYSYECGFVLHFDVSSFEHTTNIIDSLKLERPEITHKYEKHLKIYL